jgi:hypothetical protein
MDKEVRADFRRQRRVQLRPLCRLVETLAHVYPMLSYFAKVPLSDHSDGKSSGANQQTVLRSEGATPSWPSNTAFADHRESPPISCSVLCFLGTTGQ